MRELFNYDGGLMKLLNLVANLFILNLLFLFTCIPIVTIGPALTALYSATLKMARNEESYVSKNYFVAFKENFKISILSWLILLGVLLVSFVDYRISQAMENQVGRFLETSSLVLLFLSFVVALFLFPYISRFENTLKYSFKSAVFMAIASLPSTILLIAITSIFAAISYYVLPAHYTILIWLFFGFSFLAFIHSIIFKKVFAKYEPKQEKAEDDIL